MKSRRSNIEVIADILRLGEAGKTEIMYSANMSYRQLQRYLQFLIERGFIEVSKNGNPVVTYKVNKMGLRLLENIENLLGMLGLGDGDGASEALD
ncbi:MAG: hypothetical protein DRI39_08320 [Chloroflexi bacterium]|nr:MAG: hypothetical protein DRI39_08320 [Chloroflexota bacterium]RLC97144.1 MAG: hypothetical protein DRI40_01090 [Chloroflexota bacterium]